MKAVNQAIIKKDAMALVTGKPVYTDDIAPRDALVVKALRSPYAHALIRKIDTSIAKKLPGIECVLTHEDVPEHRFTIAGQTFPELSPYDRRILDQRLRFVGDAVALVAGRDEKSVDKALKVIKVDYEVLKPLLDFKTAKDNEIIVHPEEDWKEWIEVGGDNKRNLIAQNEVSYGDAEAVFKDCDIVVEGVYHTKACQQAMMETFRAYSYLDLHNRLVIVSSTQVPFHVRRIIATALGVPKSQIRVIKPRIGGGFGAKQTAVMEMYPAIVTKMTGKPAKMIYTRYESQIVSSPRHEAEIKAMVGATKDGDIKAITVHSLWNAGAFGEHSPTTVTLSGHKAISLYGDLDAFRFTYEVVYTNTIAAGAYRGYGATQGIFAVESAVNELAAKLGKDPAKIRERNMVRQGQLMRSYFNEYATSCTLDRCLARAKEMIGWDEKYPCRDMGNGKVRSIGLSLAMQSSGINNIDTGAVTIKVNDDGFYSMAVGATDMGTGCDTILAQIAAECLECSPDNIVVSGVDTDTSPYDCGSYASSTTYVTGMAVVKTCESLKERMREEAAKKLKAKPEDIEFDGVMLTNSKNNEQISLKDIGNGAMCGNTTALQATESHCSPISPPPFMAGIAEIELDKETGKFELIDFVAVVDCGTVINPALAKVQVEGGLLQGIGMAMFEDVNIDENGRIANNSFMQYHLPSRLDVGKVRVEFASSYEPSGPFGAKSIGEIVINTPGPAIADAVYNASNVRLKELPLLPEQVFMGMQKK
jgi:putative selenate reductase molybdopterin-binding subunit